MERGALESAMAARTAEVARLQADNARYASEWECREKSLVSSHELRVQHLLADLATRDKHAGELHNSLHRATVELQAHRGELQSARHELEVRVMALLGGCVARSAVCCATGYLAQTQ